MEGTVTMSLKEFEKLKSKYDDFDVQVKRVEKAVEETNIANRTVGKYLEQIKIEKLKGTETAIKFAEWISENKYKKGSHPKQKDKWFSDYINDEEEGFLSSTDLYLKFEGELKDKLGYVMSAQDET